MIETFYTAEPELRHPRRFIASASADLQRAGAVGWLLFCRNVQVRYRQSWLGYLWLILPTIASTLVWMYIQARQIVVLTPTRLPYPVHVLAGMTLWQTFIDALNAPLQQLRGGQQFILRSRVPHEALIFAGMLEVLLNCSARLIPLVALLIAYGVPIGLGMLLVPLGLAALVVLGLALGVLVAPLGMLYGDVSRAIGLATGFWFLLTPVVYRAPEHGALRFNPVTPLLETTRGWLTSSATTVRGFWIVSTAAVALLFVAWVLQRLARPHVVSRLG